VCLLLRGRVQHMLGARFAVMRVIAACILNMQIPSARALDICRKRTSAASSSTSQVRIDSSNKCRASCNTQEYTRSLRCGLSSISVTFPHLDT
jgi:hypothetical protein